MVCRGLLAQKIRCIVYDPMGTSTQGGDWGEGAEVHDDLETFLAVVYSPETTNAHLFMDEGHHIFAHDDKAHLWLLTQGRHYGLFAHVITQRPKKVHPDARSNCGRCYMFRLARDDAYAIGSDYGFNDIHKLNLDKGDFLLLNSGTSDYQRGNVFNLLE